MNRVVIAAGAGVIAALGFAPVAAAEAPQAPAAQNCKDTGFNYKICNGKRVPKGKIIAGPDGTTREVFRDGNCVTIKERSPSGEFKATRRCD